MIKDICGDIAVSLAENSPKLMIFGGVAMMIAGGVWACVKTHKDLDDAITDSNAEIEAIHEAREELPEEDYSKREYREDLTGAYGRKALRYTKTYAGPVIVTIIGVALIFGGQHILLARVASLTAAYEALDQSFREFRERVDENFGEGTSEKIALGGKLEKPIDTENKKWTFDQDPTDIYTFDFDQNNLEWVDDRSLLYSKLTDIQNALTDKLIGRLKTGTNGIVTRPGYLFLHEALDELCIDTDADGKIDLANNAGWIFDPDNPIGDNFIDIGLDNPRNAVFFFEPGTDPKDLKFRRDPIDHNDLLYLNFNCDGLIGPKLNPNQRFQLELRDKGVATVDF